MVVLARQVLYLEISKIERDAELQARVGLNAEVVKEYADQMSAGATFPPVLVFERPGAFALVDGFHRIAAREMLGLTTVLAETREGSREDAVWYGLTVNQKHGLRRSNDDKHRCVVRALTHRRAQMLSDRQLASHCGVHHYTVSRIRQQLEQSHLIEVADTRVVTRGGVSYRQRVHNRKKRSPGVTAEARAPQDGSAAVTKAPAEAEAAVERLEPVTCASLPATPIVANQAAPMRLPNRLDVAADMLERASSQERVQQLIRQAQGHIDAALREMSRARYDTERKRLFLHLTRLRKELRLAEVCFSEAPEERLNGAHSC